MYSTYDSTFRNGEGILNSQALIVFAKVPQAGKVKTRLSPPLSPEDASTLYASFLIDALEVYASFDVDVKLYVGYESDERDKFPELKHARLQQGKGLGAKMNNAFKEVFDEGYKNVCIIGTDHPTLPYRYILDAYIRLAEASAVIGPSMDGGYYLLGMDRHYRELFDGMIYSHSSVFEDTLTRAQEAGIEMDVLSEWYDVDDEASLRRLISDLADNRTLDQYALPRTRETVSYILKTYAGIFERQKQR